MLLTDFLKKGIAALEPLYPTAEARNIVLMLCEELIGTKSYTHIVEPEYQIDRKWEQPLAEAMVRLQAGEPIQYVIGPPPRMKSHNPRHNNICIFIICQALFI